MAEEAEGTKYLAHVGSSWLEDSVPGFMPGHTEEGKGWSVP